MAGKIVLVTGGTSGIGRATATGLASMEPTWPSPVVTSGARRRLQSRSGERPQSTRRRVWR